MLGIKDNVAVITGGASGIGLALAKEWVKQGGKVVIGDFNDADFGSITSELGADNCECVKINVTQEADTEKLAKTAIDKFGKINLVAPCAGVIADSMMVQPDRNDPTKAKKMPLDKWQRVIDINLTGTFLTARDCMEQMIINKCTGCVITISSTGSLGTAGQINYSSTKAAMSVFPKVLTAELMRRKLGSQIRVNAVAPGYTATAMTAGMNQEALAAIEATIPIGRMNHAEEIVSAMLELYRNEAIAGEVLFVHGGLRLGSKG
ncbi:MAG: SDR family NAD(P)-dependent oxidoreductase [Spirochaetaceae bacterium]|nr:MAG: SDR family NAD(P)-dependent oxidoreductase [Spirochaetaceae bacterium]